MGHAGTTTVLLALASLLASLSLHADAELDQHTLDNLHQKIWYERRRSGFAWLTPTEAQEVNKLTNLKPYMFLFTATSCQDCREMLDHLATKEVPAFLSGLSAQFHTVMVLDDFRFDFGDEYAPFNHDYIPRVVFADPDGKVRKDVLNKRGDAITPFYFSAREMLWTMHTVLQEYRLEWEPAEEDLEWDLPS